MKLFLNSALAADPADQENPPLERIEQLSKAHCKEGTAGARTTFRGKRDAAKRRVHPSATIFDCAMQENPIFRLIRRINRRDRKE
jgi:hypothetical protein